MTSGSPRATHAPAAGAGSERLIFALDVDGDAAARALVERLGDAVHFYKLGLGLLTSADWFGLLDWIGGSLGKPVFADLKFHDIPATVAAAVRGLRGRGVRYVTVHSDPQVMAAAVDAAGDEIGVLAVTVLTSLDLADLRRMGLDVASVEALVLDRTALAVEAGCAGVVASGREAAAVRAAVGTPLTAVGQPFRIVTPGIRPAADAPAAAGVGNAPGDQKRVVTPAAAFAAGADHIVVGRPIRDAADPRGAALAIQQTIADHFRS